MSRERFEIEKIKNQLATPLVVAFTGYLLGYGARIVTDSPFVDIKPWSESNSAELRNYQKNIVPVLYESSRLLEYGLIMILFNLYLSAKREANRKIKFRERIVSIGAKDEGQFDIYTETLKILRKRIAEDPDLKFLFNQRTVDVANILACTALSYFNPVIGLSVALVKICLSRACSEAIKGKIINEIAQQLKEELDKDPDFERVFLAQCIEEDEKKIAKEILQIAKYSQLTNS